MRKMISFFFIMCLILSGCSEDIKTDWEKSPTFTKDNMILHGLEEKFGIIKVNGESDEPEFPVGDEGRLYQVYFLEKDFIGKNFKMTATHKDTGETVKLYEWAIENKQSEAKFGFDKKGLWKISVLVDEKPYTDFIIEAEKKE
ncbi:hypothetical protein [Lysinibacillus pakistanensis]|uniref:Uncharacterized protein n=1 Tax=Lysinibacillus pakistanensis TaxID=759811 RepID=A0AAX3X2M7_9BACI|nr:hypothetical protein [Lysinibacillus pakistanensis]MDM5233441.1 hypothetical protein [Lysinibacillus pakistanensis]WHY48913.1 hypothetical protein QNH22_12025 [Lysinibacillus pakistanensis]WHY53924.1 hypothetical protein QNH24_12005 [Lysinibacillus pakistanensis]